MQVVLKRLLSLISLVTEYLMMYLMAARIFFFSWENGALSFFFRPFFFFPFYQGLSSAFDFPMSKDFSLGEDFSISQTKG